MTETATPATETVDADASPMDSVLAELSSGAESPQDATDDVVSELVEEQREGQADEAADTDEDATEAKEKQEQAAEEEPDAEDKPEPTYKVKVDGEEVEVPLSELTKGYSREQDYTRKTMALAEERKALQSQFASELQQHVELFEALDPILSEARNIDWQALAASDPATYVQLQEAVKQRQTVLAEARAKIADAQRGNPEAEAQQRAEVAQRETEALIKVMPELSDPAKLTDFANSNVQYLQSNGFKGDEIAELIDARALTIIDKARRFDALEKAKSELPAKKVVPKSQVKSLKTDAGESARSPKRLRPHASRDERVAHVLDQFFEG